MTLLTLNLTYKCFLSRPCDILVQITAQVTKVKSLNPRNIQKAIIVPLYACLVFYIMDVNVNEIEPVLTILLSDYQGIPKIKL